MTPGRIDAGRGSRSAAAIAILAGLAVTGAWRQQGRAAEPQTILVQEATIPLAHVSGRIDHMAIDLGRNRLIVAELGNGTVDVIDLRSRKVVHRIDGLKSPQGVAYVAGADMIVVASADDGTVRLFRGDDAAPAGLIALGDDADNLRVDPRSGRVAVGYGEGGLAMIALPSGTKASDMRLAAHPEGFQLDPKRGRVFVNVPDAREIAVLDMAAGKQIATWKQADWRANFPMAIGGAGDVVASAFRHPSRLALFDPDSGKTIAESETCGDADDVFFDEKRQRIYVSCGEGVVDVFRQEKEGLHRVASVPTSSGARTSLFVPQLDRLFVAARAGLLGSDASILIFRPTP